MRCFVMKRYSIRVMGYGVKNCVWKNYYNVGNKYTS
jgi:hypothetical protein